MYGDRDSNSVLPRSDRGHGRNKQTTISVTHGNSPPLPPRSTQTPNDLTRSSQSGSRCRSVLAHLSYDDRSPIPNTKRAPRQQHSLRVRHEVPAAAVWR